MSGDIDKRLSGIVAKQNERNAAQDARRVKEEDEARQRDADRQAARDKFAKDSDLLGIAARKMNARLAEAGLELKAERGQAFDNRPAPIVVRLWSRDRETDKYLTLSLGRDATAQLRRKLSLSAKPTDTLRALKDTDAQYYEEELLKFVEAAVDV